MTSSTNAVVLRLYVVGNSPKSLRAKVNLEAICKDSFPQGCKLEIVDVLEEPLRLIADGIAVTPALVKLAPAPIIKMMGDLSDRTQVVLALTSCNGGATV